MTLIVLFAIISVFAGIGVLFASFFLRYKPWTLVSVCLVISLFVILVSLVLLAIGETGYSALTGSLGLVSLANVLRGAYWNWRDARTKAFYSGRR